jgi:hypothetical protein
MLTKLCVLPAVCLNHEPGIDRRPQCPRDLDKYVEYPALVALRICQFADVVAVSVIAGTDCGFGTFAGYGKLDPDISFKKLGAMVEGAAIASKRLSGGASSRGQAVA